MPGLTNQFGSWTGGLGESSSYVEWGGLLQSQLVRGPRQDPCFSCPPVRAPRARRGAHGEEPTPAAPTPLPRAGRAARGCAGLVAATLGGRLVRRGGWLLPKVPPLSGSSGFAYPEGALERGRPSSRSVEGAGLAWGALQARGCSGEEEEEEEGWRGRQC